MRQGIRGWVRQVVGAAARAGGFYCRPLWAAATHGMATGSCFGTSGALIKSFLFDRSLCLGLAFDGVWCVNTLQIFRLWSHCSVANDFLRPITDGHISGAKGWFRPVAALESGAAKVSNAAIAGIGV